MDNPISSKLNRSREQAKKMGFDDDGIARDPRYMSVEDLNAMGHEKRSFLKIIRANCLECCNHSQDGVKRCRIVTCCFWPYRMNKNPFAKRDLTEEQRKTIAERLQKQ